MPTSPPAPLTICTKEDIGAGVRFLIRQCPHLRRVHANVGDPPLRRMQPDFAGLARIIVGQQVSAASANAIWQRTADAIVPFRPAKLLAMSDAALRGAGLSRPKIRTLRATASAIADRRLNLSRLAAADDDDVRSALTEVNGIGPWTADLYLMFCLGRPDSWASGDLALQLATQWVFDLAVKPDAQQLEEIAERWRPWRGVAARLLWDYYADQKKTSSKARKREDASIA